MTLKESISTWGLNKGTEIILGSNWWCKFLLMGSSPNHHVTFPPILKILCIWKPCLGLNQFRKQLIDKGVIKLETSKIQTHASIRDHIGRIVPLCWKLTVVVIQAHPCHLEPLRTPRGPADQTSGKWPWVHQGGEHPACGPSEAHRVIWSGPTKALTTK